MPDAPRYHIIAQCEPGRVYLDPTYICAKCGMRTDWREEIEAHVKTHEGEADHA